MIWSWWKIYINWCTSWHCHGAKALRSRMLHVVHLSFYANWRWSNPLTRQNKSTNSTTYLCLNYWELQMSKNWWILEKINCIVTANAAITSVTTAVTLRNELGLGFIGAVKILTFMYLTDLTIKIPVVCEIYYLTAGTINHHHAICTNQCRIYHAIVTINLLKCLKLTMFAMMITDVWLLYKYACGNSNTLMSAQFVEFLAIEMIVIGCKYRVTMRAGAIVLKMNGIDINVQQRPTKCFRKGSNTH